MRAKNWGEEFAILKDIFNSKLGDLGDNNAQIVSYREEISKLKKENASNDENRNHDFQENQHALEQKEAENERY